MSQDQNARLADAQRRALFAAEVIVNRRLHDFSTRYQSQYSNDVAVERKAIEGEIRAIRRRVPAPPVVTDALVTAVSTAAGQDADATRAVLLALAAQRPDLLSATEPEEWDEDDEE